MTCEFVQHSRRGPDLGAARRAARPRRVPAAHQHGAALARRFRARVGESPIAYLTGWRMALAADRLRESGDTVARVAAEVGYPSPFSFSNAFKRVYGVSPSAYRSLSSPA